jgi:hypothetical protein
MRAVIDRRPSSIPPDVAARLERELAAMVEGMPGFTPPATLQVGRYFVMVTAIDDNGVIHGTIEH